MERDAFSEITLYFHIWGQLRDRTQETEKKDTTISFLSWRCTTKFTFYYSLSQSNRWMPNTDSSRKLPASLIRAGPDLMSLLYIWEETRIYPLYQYADFQGRNLRVGRNPPISFVFSCPIRYNREMQWRAKPVLLLLLVTPYMVSGAHGKGS